MLFQPYGRIFLNGADVQIAGAVVASCAFDFSNYTVQDLQDPYLSLFFCMEIS